MKRLATLALAASLCAAPAFAQEGSVPAGIPHLDHVFVIMMENHAYDQVVGNPNDPFINRYIRYANAASNYFAVGHPSLTNYLEIVGGSNFGVRTDNSPDWHNSACSTNLSTGMVSTDTPATGPICPIFGTGTDAETPAIDYTNETSGPPGDIDLTAPSPIRPIPKPSAKPSATSSSRLASRGRAIRKICRPPALTASIPPMASSAISPTSPPLCPVKARRRAIWSPSTPSSTTLLLLPQRAGWQRPRQQPEEHGRL